MTETKSWPALLAALFISLGLLTLPTAAPDLDADASWCAVLRWAHEHRLQFGTDIVFTYGPMGFLFAPYILWEPGGTMVWSNAALCFLSALGLCLVAWRLEWRWRCLLLGIFILETAAIDFRVDFTVEVGLLCWGLLCMVEAGRRQQFHAVGFVLLAGAVSLIKISHLLAAGFSVCAVVLYSMCGGKRRMGILLTIGFAAVFLPGWLACGQVLSNLGPFLANGIRISRDYDQGVVLDGLPMLRCGGALLGILATAAVLLNGLSGGNSTEPHANWRRGTLTVWLAGLLFMVWKHSMVRLDRQHFAELVVFAPVVALVLDGVAGSGLKARWAGRGLALCCCLVSWSVMEYTFLPGLTDCLSQPFRQLAYHAQCLVFPGHWRRDLEPGLEANRREAELPKLRSIIGKESVDVFGFHQAHALLNDLNYRPRPGFQSYAVYTSVIARMNEDFYLSEHAPTYVLLDFSGLDHRLAALNDALAFRALLSSYSAVATEGPFVLLKRESAVPAKLTLLREGTITAQERISLSQYGKDNLWMELEVEPSLLGRFAGFASRPATARLAAWRQTTNAPALIARGRAPPTLLRTGFIASPCLLNLQDIRDFYSGERIVRPDAYSVELTSGSRWFWKPVVRFRLYKIENRLGR